MHSVPSDRDNRGGDIKLYGRAVEQHDAEVRSAYREAILSRIDWAPAEPDFHLFSFDVREAGFIYEGIGRSRQAGSA